MIDIYPVRLGIFTILQEKVATLATRNERLP